jgi:hypothetical protein
MIANVRVIAAVIVLLAGRPAQAHHGFGTFDMRSEVEITGTVTDFAFVNPHSWLYLDVEENGEIVPYRCEMRSATTLRRSGWTPDMFPVGEPVTITGSPDRNEPHACYVSTVIVTDGSSIDRYGQRTPPTLLDSGPRPLRRASGEPNITGEWAAEQLVMTDPRGVSGSLVPLSEAPEEPVLEGPLIAGEAARRLFVARVEMTEAGRAATERMQAAANPAMTCEPISVLVDWTYDSPVNRITQNADTIVLEYGKFDYVRTVEMDARHPSVVEPSLTGHSIGHWEDDVLVVDTVGFAAGALTRTLPHSERLHFVERFTLDSEAMALTRKFVADDPDYFAAPYTGYDVVYPSNVPFAPSTCDDRSLFE